MTLLAMAVAPAILLMFFFWLKDRYEPEPRGKIALVMFLGGLTVIPAIVLETLGERLVTLADQGAPPLVDLFLHTFVVIAVSEELGKYLVVRWTLFRDPEFDEPYDGIVYCVAASLGFALVENVFYVVAGGAGIAILRALMAVPAHALFGVAMGYYLGQARFADTRAASAQLQLLGFLSTVVMHGAYDFVLFSQRPLLILTVFPLMILFWVLGLRLVRRHVDASPHKSRALPRTGGPLGAPPVCPHCLAPLHPGGLYCGHCGAQISAGA